MCGVVPSMDIHHKPFLFTGRLLLLCVVIVLASFALYLSLSLWAGKGEPLLPLDDVYIHFQYARQLAFGQPNVYNPGQPPSSGATSFIYPVFLAIGYLLGFQEMWLGLWALLLGAFAQMLVLVAILRWAMSWSLSSAWTALLLLLVGLTGSLTWHFYAGMETGLLLASLLWTLVTLMEKRRVGFVVTASLLVLLRPEGGVLACIAIAVALWHMRPLDRKSLYLFLPIVFFFVQPLLNGILTGTLIASGNQSKSLLGMVPFDWLVVFGRILDNILRAFGELLLGMSQNGTWYHPPLLGASALISLIILLRSPERRATAILVILWIAALIPMIATLDTAFWHFKRYQAPLLLLVFPVLLIPVGDLLSSRQRWKQAIIAAWLLGWASFIGLDFAHSFAANVSYVYAQPRQMAAWLTANTPKDAVIAVHDVGLMRYAGQRTTLDLVGLTTSGAAPYWRNGPGSVTEFILAEKPDYIAAYGQGHQVGLRMLVDTRLYNNPLAFFQVTLDPRINVALAADSQAIYQPDWAQLSDRILPMQPSTLEYIQKFRLVGTVNPADMDSESEYEYQWVSQQRRGFASEPRDLDYLSCSQKKCRILDAVRSIDREESFILDEAVAGEDMLLVSRVHTSDALELTVYVDDQVMSLRTIPAHPGNWLELVTYVSAQYVRPGMVIRLVPQSNAGVYQPAYHWLYQGHYPEYELVAPQDVLASYQDGALWLADYSTRIEDNRLYLQIHWGSNGAASGNYRLFLHIYDDYSQPPIAQLDTYLGSGGIQLGNMLPGALRDDFVVDLGEIPPGTYALALGFYELNNDQRLLPLSKQLDVLGDGRLILDPRLEVIEGGR